MPIEILTFYYASDQKRDVVCPYIVQGTEGMWRIENAIDLIVPELKKSIGMNMKDPLRISGELAYAEIPIQEDSFLQEAYSHNPRMIQEMLQEMLLVT